MIRQLTCSLLLALVPTACGTVERPPSAKVFKSDGSVQCGSAGTSVEEMSKELTDKGIDVTCGQKSSDGYGYCAACGCGTGQINVYTIHSQNVSDAESLGFAPVSDLPDYQDERCT